MTWLQRWSWLDAFRVDARFAFRMFAKNPTFTIVATITIALGIGINTAVFTVTNAALLRGFPLVQNNERVLYVTNKSVPYLDFEDWRAQATSFSEMAGTQGLFKFVSGPAESPEVYSGTSITPNTFHVLGVHPRLGRDFVDGDGRPGAAPVAILSYDLWERRFARDPQVIHSTMQLNGVATSIIGVMPEGFAFPQKQDLWLPIVPTADVLQRNRGFLMMAVGRLANAANIDIARAEMEAIGLRLARDYPETNHDIPVVKTFEEMFIGRSATVLYKTLLGAVSVVLIIACVNVANLLLGRALSRSREISLRSALGAGRSRIVRQLLVESVMLSSIGGGMGWWIAKTILRVYVRMQRGDSWFAHILMYAMDYRVFAYFVAISVATGLLFGLVPALRVSSLDVNTSLKDGGRGVFFDRYGKRWSALLIAAEVALAVLLLAGAAATVRSFLNIYNANVGARTEGLLAAYIAMPQDRYPNADLQIAFYERLKSRLETLPGVESVAVGPAPTETIGRYPYEVDGAERVDPRNNPTTIVSRAGEGYFKTLDAVVLSGREFTDLDRAASLPVVIVNERFAARNWPGEPALGKHLRVFRNGKPDAWLTVVGVVSNISQNDPTRQQFEPTVYLSFRQQPGDIGIVARTRVPAERITPGFQRELHAIDPTVPFQHLAPATTWMSMAGGAYELQRNIAALFMVFGVVALLLASVGLYSVAAQSVSRRTQEIGIRTALGATANDIRGLVFRQGMLPLAMGLGIGFLVSAALNRVLEAQLVHARPADPSILGAVSIVLVFFAALGLWVPARRATRVDPVIALRHE